MKSVSAPGPAGKGGGAGNASQAESDLGFIRFALTSHAEGTKSDRLPKDLNEAASSIKVIDERIYARVRNGDYVIRWGEPLKTPILAYEKDALTKGGWVWKGNNGMVEKLTAEELKKQLGGK